MKTRILIFFLSVCSVCVYGQDQLIFNKRFVQSEDTWVAYPISKDSSYNFGFIYIDPSAGLTFDLAGDFKIGPNGEFIRGEDKIKTSVKMRLMANNVKVAHIPEAKFTDLKIERFPKWLSSYKNGEGTKERLYQWGYMYNGWGECEKALEYLEKAKAIDPDYKGLRVELAYSYNCLKRYNDAVSILTEALKRDPKDAYTHKELIYSQIKLGQIEQGERSFRNALEICEDKSYNPENAYQILHGYFLKKDPANFNKWLVEFGALIDQNDQLSPNAKKMKIEMDKQSLK